MKNSLPRAYGFRILHQRLQKRRAELVREIDLHRSRARDGGGALVPGEDGPALVQAAELDLAEAERDSAELAAIDTALTRMQLGQYGICARCGDSLPHARLEALPHALHCMACAATAGKGTT